MASPQPDKPFIPFGFKDHSLKYIPYAHTVLVDQEDIIQKEVEERTLNAEKEIEKEFPLQPDGSFAGLGANVDAMEYIDMKEDQEDQSVDFSDDMKSLIMLGLVKTDEATRSKLLKEETSTVDMDGDVSSYMTSLESTMDDFGLSFKESINPTKEEVARREEATRFIKEVLDDPIQSVEHWQAFDRFHGNRLRSTHINEHFEQEKEKDEEEALKTEASEDKDVNMDTENVVALGESIGKDPDEIRATLKMILDQADSGIQQKADIQSQHNMENHFEEEDFKMAQRKNEMISRMQYAENVHLE